MVVIQTYKVKKFIANCFLFCSFRYLNFIGGTLCFVLFQEVPNKAEKCPSFNFVQEQVHKVELFAIKCLLLMCDMVYSSTMFNRLRSSSFCITIWLKCDCSVKKKNLTSGLVGVRPSRVETLWLFWSKVYVNY